MKIKELKKLIDKVGDLRSDIKEMQAEDKELCHIMKEPFYKLIEKGLVPEINGENYHATFDKHERENVDWKSLAIMLGATSKQIKKYTKTNQVERFIITQK